MIKDVTLGRQFDPEESTARRCTGSVLLKNLIGTKSDLVFLFAHSHFLSWTSVSLTRQLVYWRAWPCLSIQLYLLIEINAEAQIGT